ncbi:hypothetical protein J7E88_32430 [Streptomyces sp. ISL-10]|uniref:hypothetical protein n=1 Tax=Streptomyces sp. ISL-10 TaxID=2819172 RepID=UPI001BEBF0F4|nr:hypothetical protein [Streptomyces sp. ISL-10]MBT2369853.1 hypothetical protein [Streptomyces sp. ISL-10]
MQPELTEAQVLDVWESGVRQEPPVRALLLAAVAASAGEDVADRPLAALRSLLLDLRCGSFGDVLPCTTDCPACDESLEVMVGAEELRATPGTGTAPAPDPRPAAGPGPMTAGLTAGSYEITFRALTGRDLLAVDPVAPQARRTLLSRCVVSVEPPTDALPDEVLEEVAQRLPDLDPGADTVLSLSCPHCHHEWWAALDVADHLWAEVDAYARRLLHDIHVLARAYGWSESDVLTVSPARRQFYLEAAAG